MYNFKILQERLGSLQLIGLFTRFTDLSKSTKMRMANYFKNKMGFYDLHKLLLLLNSCIYFPNTFAYAIHITHALYFHTQFLRHRWVNFEMR